MKKLHLLVFLVTASMGAYGCAELEDDAGEPALEDLEGGLAPLGKADAADGTALGKRYVNEAGDLELLCTKPGDGSLGANGEVLVLKEAKPLPSSD